MKKLVLMFVAIAADLKSKENEKVSFNVRSYRSYFIRILW